MKYYYSNADNQAIGPIEWDELVALANRGVVNDQTPVIAEGQQVWTTYGQVKSGTAVADALASGFSHASSAAAAFPWGSMFFGLLLSVVGGLMLPWSVFTGAARELASWGKQRALPLASSDLPVLTFYIIVSRNFILVVFGLFFTICAFLSIFGAGPLYHATEYGFMFRLGGGMPFPRESGGWSVVPAFGGFILGLLISYFGQLAIAFWFEVFSIGVRIANDIKRLASR